jgi:hypothetical protein
MKMEEIVAFLGRPTNVTQGSSLVDGGGIVVASSSTISTLKKTQYACWYRPEAEYYLNIVDGRLAKIHEVRPSLPTEYYEELLEVARAQPNTSPERIKWIEEQIKSKKEWERERSRGPK